MLLNPAILLLLGILVILPASANDEMDSVTTQDQQLLSRVNQLPELVKKGTILPEQVPDPHWHDDRCMACHKGNPLANPLQLLDDNIDQLCQYCHSLSFELSDSHPIGIKPEAAMTARMPATYRDALEKGGGFLGCITCHDLPAQCLGERRREKGRNPEFLRDGPFRTRIQQCFLCHDAKSYKRLNPHEQITKSGQVIAATCVICHSEKLELLRSIKDDNKLDFYGEHDLKNLCIRCHPWVPHPGGAFGISPEEAGAKHLQKPPAEDLKVMQQKAIKSGLTLPLEPGTGKIYCATCHDPHEKGILENKISGEKVDTRLRAEKICIQCHWRRL